MFIHDNNDNNDDNDYDLAITIARLFLRNRQSNNTLRRLFSFILVHGEWEILEKSQSSSTVQRNRESFSRLVFTLRLRRRPLFHMLNTLFPVVLMGFLTVCYFFVINCYIFWLKKI